jgi:bidirectional [NiFe] hydrogenase diaphorase subunit
MSPEELEQIAETEREQQKAFTHTLNVCVAAGCLSCQSQGVKDALDQEIKTRGTEHTCRAKGVGCTGLCAEGPLVSTDNGILYKRVAPGDAAEILDSLEDRPLAGYCARPTFRFSNDRRRSCWRTRA